jgi:hypothetical protein
MGQVQINWFLGNEASAGFAQQQLHNLKQSLIAHA